MTMLIEKYKKNKECGDVARVARAVNTKRMERGEEPITQTYVGMMLRGARTMTEEVHEIASRYFEVQEELKEELIA